MASITFFRHAKAEPPQAGLEDFDRVLAPRWKDQLHAHGPVHEAERVCFPNSRLSRQPPRTRETWQLASDEWPDIKVEFDDGHLRRQRRDPHEGDPSSRGRASKRSCHRAQPGACGSSSPASRAISAKREHVLLPDIVRRRDRLRGRETLPGHGRERQAGEFLEGEGA